MYPLSSLLSRCESNVRVTGGCQATGHASLKGRKWSTRQHLPGPCIHCPRSSPPDHPNPLGMIPGEGFLLPDLGRNPNFSSRAPISILMQARDKGRHVVKNLVRVYFFVDESLLCGTRAGNFVYFRIFQVDAFIHLIDYNSFNPGTL